MSITEIPSVLKTILAFITSIISSITVLICPTPADTSSAKLINEQYYSVVESYVTGQGLDCDENYFYTSGAISAFKIGGLAKIDRTTGQIIKMNTFALPKEFQDKGYDHIGDIAYGNGVIYAPVEDKAEKYPLILIYDAETLEYTGTYYEMDATYLTDGIPWCAVDENYLYASPINNPLQIAVFNLSDMSFSHIIPISAEIDRIQAGDVFDGKLYLNSDTKQGKKLVYEIDLATETTSLLFDRNISGYGTEAEGICVERDENGELVFYIADYNKIATTIVRTYTLK